MHLFHGLYDTVGVGTNSEGCQIGHNHTPCAGAYEVRSKQAVKRILGMDEEQRKLYALVDMATRL